ncbi:MAG: oligosaccharide flippase family protein, partial [Sphingobacterium sp.]
MSLRNQAMRGVKWTSIAAIIGAVIQIIQIAVLTRFLDKEDFGLMAIALFVIGISQIFIDMGISNAIIHKRKVNHFQLNTLFWLNIIMGIVLFTVVLVISPWIAKFYHDVKLIKIINLIALTFLIIPWGQQIEALLKKDLMFKELSVRDIIGKIIGFLVAVVLAFLNF